MVLNNARDLNNQWDNIGFLFRGGEKPDPSQENLILVILPLFTGGEEQGFFVFIGNAEEYQITFS